MGSARRHVPHSSPGSTADGSTANLRYDGIAHDFTLSRNADGNYAFTDGTTRLAGYNYRTCS